MSTFTQFDMYLLVASVSGILTGCIAMGVAIGNWMSR